MYNILVGSKTKVRGLTQSISKEIRKGEPFTVSSVGPFALHTATFAICYAKDLCDMPYNYSYEIEKVSGKERDIVMVKYTITPKRG